MPWIRRCALLVMVWLSLATWACAAEFYVSYTGDDANPGTLDYPFATITYGASQLSPGDTLYVRQGIYREHLRDVIPNGTPEAWVTVAGYPGERPVLTFPASSGDGTIQFYTRPASYIVVRNFLIDPSARGGSGNGVTVLRQHHHLLLEDIEVMRVGRHGITSGAAAHHIVWRRMHVHHVGNTSKHHGVYISNSDTIVEDSEFSHASQYGVHVYYSDTSRGIRPTNVVVRGNYIHHNNLGAISNYLMQSVQRYNNIIVDNAIDGLRLGNTSGHRIWNNTLYNNGQYDLQILTDNNQVSAINNLIGRSAGQPRASEWVSNLVGPHAQFASPLYRLVEDSPAIDAGAVLAEVPLDKDGVERPQGISTDISAYEYIYPEQQLASMANLVAHNNNFDSNNPVEGLFDGCLDGSAICSPGNNKIASFFVVFDMGTAQLTRARLFGDADGTWRSQGWSLRVADAPEGLWASVFEQQPALDNAWFEESLEGIEGRYVKVVVFGTPMYSYYNTQARELEIYGIIQ